MTAIAIDGPAGAGKSTVARALARHLGWAYVDTGAMYRAVALAALERGVDLDDGGALRDLARSIEIDALDDAIVVDGVDATARIRASDVTAAVSKVAAHTGVRDELVNRQRRLARRRDVVMEGRDIGATVVPEAPVKVFLTAAPDVRALRRCRQLGLGDDAATVAEVRRELLARDAADASRAASPLMQAADAVVVDSTAMDVDEVVQLILGELPERRVR